MMLKVLNKVVIITLFEELVHISNNIGHRGKVYFVMFHFSEDNQKLVLKNYETVILCHICNISMMHSSVFDKNSHLKQQELIFLHKEVVIFIHHPCRSDHNNGQILALLSPKESNFTILQDLSAVWI